MPRKRALPMTASVVSCTSTDSSSSLSGSFLLDSPHRPPIQHEGWMYWRRDGACWLKVYAVLRRNLLYLTRSAATLTAPLVHVAVARVERATAPGRGLWVWGPRGEAMELHLYHGDELWMWLDALEDAALATRTTMEEHQRRRRHGRHSSHLLSTRGPGTTSSSSFISSPASTTASTTSATSLASPPNSVRRAMSTLTSRRTAPALDQDLRGTLVLYHEERKGSRWRRFWDSLCFREAFRRRIEEVVDRLDGSVGSAVGPRPSRRTDGIISNA